jgi:hypothetical protein
MLCKRWVVAAAGAALLAGAAAQAQEPPPKGIDLNPTTPTSVRRGVGFFLGAIGGGSIVHESAVYTAEQIGQQGSGVLGEIEASLRPGWRFPGGFAALAEARFGLILGTLTGSAEQTWAGLAGAQWTPASNAALLQPFVNLRGGVRRDPLPGVHSTVAIGAGIEVMRGRPSTLVELTFEPLSPWLLSIRVGAVW